MSCQSRRCISSFHRWRRRNLGDQAGVAGAHEIFAGLLGQRASLGVVIKTISVVGMLVVILDDPRGDLAGSILLTRSFREGRVADHRHRSARPVVDEVRSRGNTRASVVGMQGVPHLATLAVIIAVRGQTVTIFARFLGVVLLGILSQVKTLHSGGTLVADAANNIRNRIGLVPKVAVCHVSYAQTGKTFVPFTKAREMLIHLRVRILHGTLRRAAGLRSRAASRSLLGGLGGGRFLGLRSLSDGGLLLDGLLLSQLGELGRAANGANDVLHVMGLAVDQAAKVEHHALSIVALAAEVGVVVLQARKLLLVALALALQLLGDLLLKNQRLQGVIPLLLRSGQAQSETGGVVLLLVDEAAKATVLPLVVFDLDLELGGLLGELLGEGLELEELLLPRLKLLNQEVVALGDLAQLGVHTALEVDKVLPSLHGVPRVLVALPHDLIQMAHGHLRHQGLLDRAAENGLHTGVASQLLADVIHDAHDGVLVPPRRLLDALNLASHHNDLTGGDQLSPGIGRSKMVGNARGRDIAVQRLRQAVNELRSLSGIENVRRARRQHEVAVQIHNQGVRRGVEQRAALGGDTQNVRTGFLDQILDMTSMNHWHVQATPLVNSNAVTNRFGGDREHGGVVTDEDDAASRGHRGFDDTHDVGNGQTREQRPHGEVLESRGRRRELVAQGIILHVNADQVVQARGREAENPRHLLCMEQVGGLVPMDPHTPEVVTQQVVEGVSREETQAIGDPVDLLRVIVEIGLGLFAEFTDSFGTLLVGSGPDTQSNAVKSVGRILLQDEGMVGTVRLGLAGTNLNIVRETGLVVVSWDCLHGIPPPLFNGEIECTYPHSRMQRFGNLIVLFQAGTAAQDFWQPKLAHGSLHMTDLSLGRRRSPDPLGGLPAHTANHVGMGQGLGRFLGGFGAGLRRDRLRNAGVKRGGATRNDQRIFSLIAGGRPVARGRTGEGRVVSQRRTHGECRRGNGGLNGESSSFRRKLIYIDPGGGVCLPPTLVPRIRSIQSVGFTRSRNERKGDRVDSTARVALLECY